MNQQNSTTEEVSWILSKIDITINGSPYILELYEANSEYTINDENCSTDPSESHREYLPKDYYKDSVTPCLYKIDLEKHDI